MKRLFFVRSEAGEDGRSRTYRLSGQVFFASTDAFLDAFDYREVLDRVTIDVSAAHFWDISAVAALDKAVLKFRREGTAVEHRRPERGKRDDDRPFRHDQRSVGARPWPRAANGGNLGYETSRLH